MNTSLRDNPRYNWWLVLGLLIAVYLVINLALGYIGNAMAATYIARPLLWGLLAWAILTFPKYRPLAKPRLKNPLIQLALMVGFFQIIALVIGGLFFGFGRSTTSFTPLPIIRNLFLVVLTLIGTEISRAWLVKRLSRHHTFFALALVTLLYTLLAIPLATLISPREPLQMVSYLNSRVFPLLAGNLLASYLALLAGPLAAIAYLGILQAFWLFSPVLPDLTWVLRGLIGTAVPILGLVIVNRFYSSKTLRSRAGRAREGSLAGWIVTTIVAVVIIWFSVGLFPLHPTLVGSGSMRPAMDVGDVLIVSEVQPDSIEPGDVIQFRTPGEFTMIHRVVEIIEIEGTRFFITKGDANDKPDPDPVIPGNVVGKAVFTIPKIGWVAIWVKGFFTE